MKIKKSTKKKVKKVNIGLRRKNPDLIEGQYYQIETKNGDVYKGRVDEAKVVDGVGQVLVALIARNGDEFYLRHDNIKNYKVIDIRSFYGYDELNRDLDKIFRR